QVAGWDLKDAPVRPAEGALLDDDIVAKVQGMHLDVGVGEGAEPTAEEPDAGCLACAAQPAWCPEDDLVREHAGKSIEVMGIKGLGSLIEGLAYGHCHARSLALVAPRSLQGSHPGLFSSKQRGELTPPLDAKRGVGPRPVALDGLERYVQLLGNLAVG